MPRWRRPGPLFWDVVLALVVAGLSTVTVETSRSSPVIHEPAVGSLEIGLGPPPPGLGPGDVWDAEITVIQHGRQLTPFREIKPQLIVTNTRTGESTTYRAKPTHEPGLYRARVIFPDKAVYSYDVRGDGLVDTVAIGEPAAQQSPDVGPASDSSPVWPFGLALLASLPIAVRRRYPIAVLAITLASALALDVFWGSFQLAGALVAMYTVAAHVGRPRSIGVALATSLALTFTFFDDTGIQDSLGNWEDAAGHAAMYALFGAAWLLGDNMRTRRAYLREVEERATRLEREREENVRRAAADEQARIARELHDIIAHNVSVMTVQAAAAGDVFDTQPSRAREALGSIESTGREALTELRRLLGHVRPGDGSGTFAPQPRLDRLDGLLAQVRAAGLPVELIVEGTPRELSPGVNLSAYRIVQEALTNTIKHAHASEATVTIRYGEEELELEIVDDGRGLVVDGTDPGHGLIGMRERAALVGGELRTGSGRAGGFSVQARIPLEEPE